MTEDPIMNRLDKLLDEIAKIKSELLEMYPDLQNIKNAFPEVLEVEPIVREV